MVLNTVLPKWPFGGWKRAKGTAAVLCTLRKGAPARLCCHGQQGEFREQNLNGVVM